MTSLSDKVGRGMKPSDLVYERFASTLTVPVPASTSGHILVNWSIPQNRNAFLVYAVGNDQHDSSYYTWVFDGTTMPISGSAKVGGIYDPLVFPEPIRVETSILLYIRNDNAKAYPNSGTIPTDQIPYEAVIIGRWV